MTLNILGIGHAYPETIVTNEFLESINPDLKGLSASAARYSVLSLKYIEETGNLDPTKALQFSSETPTSLAERAAKLALERAGIQAEQLGLIIADTISPSETIPCEAHRIAKSLGLKIPAYDIAAASNFFVLLLEQLSAWLPERLPEYVLIVSSNTPTQRLNYRFGHEPLYFGDAAGAAVLSFKANKGFSLGNVNYQPHSLENQRLSVDLYGHLRLDPELIQNSLAVKTRAQIEFALKAQSKPLESFSFVGPQFPGPSLNDSRSALDRHKVHTWSNVESVAHTFGAAPFGVISENWQDLQGKAALLVVTAAATGAGYCWLNLVSQGEQS